MKNVLGLIMIVALATLASCGAKEVAETSTGAVDTEITVETEATEEEATEEEAMEDEAMEDEAMEDEAMEDEAMEDEAMIDVEAETTVQ